MHGCRRRGERRKGRELGILRERNREERREKRDRGTLVKYGIRDMDERLEMEGWRKREAEEAGVSELAWSISQ